MLEHIPAWLGASLRSVRAGADKLAITQPNLGDFSYIDLASPAFANGAALPPRFTADGAGLSPPLVWGEVPPDTKSLALIVEDFDAPSPHPFVHAIIWGMASDAHRLGEGDIVADGDGGGEGDVGRNSYLREGWLPPDPPYGHGLHHYAFQLFALSGAHDPGPSPGRNAFLDAIRGHVIAAGLLIGTYTRDEAAPDPAFRPATAPG
ncbi:YbhB/YbcL family Raf kinase inhibitor-like protein [Allosphingosinicella flava]|uniref:YbhB/YbcL family Raf kinase inhibitor-like protein n=1 Tax=Allosphingosinicella flava TaxID=2771430 RepID=A0A7T2GIJ0_9SPHN|nr:YbhB/YbcL family Raf kinase inhibitor-like protein [Sphingosinicella flava]QPQ54486.1 YbhB/YbcL family Raf kinase inhibitor-like protein [Sphingosinicella flava]